RIARIDYIDGVTPLQSDCAVFDGKWVKFPCSHFSTNATSPGMFRLHLQQKEMEWVPVENYPLGANQTSLFMGVRAHYIPESHKIIIVGGTLGNDTEGITQDGIWEIQLDDPDPIPFDCEGKEDGMYPHPQDCDKFIGCRGGEMTGVYECPEPLL